LAISRDAAIHRDAFPSPALALIQGTALAGIDPLWAINGLLDEAFMALAQG
jgi:hypothetical protein